MPLILALLTVEVSLDLLLTPSLIFPPSLSLSLSVSHPAPNTSHPDPVKSKGKPTASAVSVIMALEQSMPKVYKKIMAAADAPPPSKSQKAVKSAPAESSSSGNSRFGESALR
jgi:hypothetical protein